MLFELNNDTGRRLFCGPGAICLLTGVPASRVEAMLIRARNDWCREQTGKRYYKDHKRRQFKGAYNSEVVTVLERLGCKVERMTLNGHAQSTIARLADDMQHAPGSYLVEVTNHYMVTQGGFIADNWYSGTQFSWDTHPHGKRHVRKLWKVTAPATPKYTEGLKPRAKKEKPERDIKAVRAARIAEQVKAWEGKLKRAQTALKKLRPKLRRYQKLGVAVE